MSYKCRFCGEAYDTIYPNLQVLCCNKGFHSKGTTALVEIKEKNK